MEEWKKGGDQEAHYGLSIDRCTEKPDAYTIEF